MYVVLYSKKLGGSSKAPVVLDSWFNRVCEIEAASLEAVFEYMNGKGPREHGVRSMSVGDVVLAEDGAWRCEPAGWQLVDMLRFSDIF